MKQLKQELDSTDDELPDCLLEARKPPYFMAQENFITHNKRKQINETHNNKLRNLSSQQNEWYEKLTKVIHSRSQSVQSKTIKTLKGLNRADNRKLAAENYLSVCLVDIEKRKRLK